MRRALLLLLIVATGCRRTELAHEPGRTVAQGWEHFRLGEFDLAAAAFAAGQSADAVFGAATTWDLRRPGQDPDKAEALYRRVLTEWPTSDEAAWSLLAMARMKYAVPGNQEPDRAAVARGFQAVMDRFPTHLAGQEAFLSLQALRLEEPTAEAARPVLAALDEFLRQQPTSPYRSAAHSLRAHCYRLLQNPDKKLAEILAAWKTAEIDPRNPGQDLVSTYWRIATVAEFDVGDFALAREYYRKLIAEYPTEQRVFLAKQELQHMDAVEAQLRRELAGAK